MTKHHQSAGIVLFRNSKPGRQYLLLDYGHHWDFPKGHVEPREQLLQTALRELEEETGITDAKILSGYSHEIEYFFRDKKKNLIHKTVWFCLGETETETEKVRLSDEHVAYEFLLYPAALKRLTYAAAKALLQSAEEFVQLISQEKSI